MPALSPTMGAGTLARRLVKEGDVRLQRGGERAAGVSMAVAAPVGLVTPVINPVQVLILAQPRLASGLAPKAAGRLGQGHDRRDSFDHRAFDGAFLARFKHLVEHPLAAPA